MRRVLARMEPRLLAAFLAAVARARGALDVRAVAEIIATYGVAEPGLLYGAAQVDTLIGSFAREVAPLVEQYLKRAGIVGAPIFAAGMGVEPLDIELFQARAAGLARQLVGEAITNIDATQREAVREIVSLGYSEGLSPLEQARMIEQTVGLDASRAGAFEKFLQDLQDDPPDLSEAEIQRLIDRTYAQKLRSRALSIARTESAAAARFAQNGIWEQAIEEGRLPLGKYLKQWLRIPAAKPCPICGPLHLKTAPIGGRYPGGLAGPPAHPHCRCGERLIDAPEHGSAEEAAGW